jgi:hypothetical protein
MIAVDSKSVGRFDQTLAVQRLFPSAEVPAAHGQLPQAKQLATRRLVPYIVRDGQLQCGIRPTAFVPNGWCPFGHNIGGF